MKSYSTFLAEAFDSKLELEYHPKFSDHANSIPSVKNAKAYTTKVGDQDLLVLDMFNEKRNAHEIHLNNMNNMMDPGAHSMMNSGHHETAKLFGTIKDLSHRHLKAGHTMRVQSFTDDQHKLHHRIAEHVVSRHNRSNSDQYKIQDVPHEENVVVDGSYPTFYIKPV